VASWFHGFVTTKLLSHAISYINDQFKSDMIKKYLRKKVETVSFVLSFTAVYNCILLIVFV